MELRFANKSNLLAPLVFNRSCWQKTLYVIPLNCRFTPHNTVRPMIAHNTLVHHLAECKQPTQHLLVYLFLNVSHERPKTGALLK